MVTLAQQKTAIPAVLRAVEDESGLRVAIEKDKLVARTR